MSGAKSGRWAKDLVAALESHGYEYSRTNSKNWDVYECNGREVIVSPSVDERACRSTIRKLQQHHGTLPETGKRKPDVIRERQAKERDAIKEQLCRDRARLLDLQSARLRELGGAAALLTTSEINAIEKRIVQRERELREIESLMSIGSLGNRAQHTAGNR